MRVLAVVLLLINVIGAVSSFYILRSSSQGDDVESLGASFQPVPYISLNSISETKDVTDSSPSLIRLRRSGILFGKLARNWAADDKRVVLRPLVEYEPDPWH